LKKPKEIQKPHEMRGAKLGFTATKIYAGGRGAAMMCHLYELRVRVVPTGHVGI
jgi:hypothetical protein